MRRDVPAQIARLAQLEAIRARTLSPAELDELELLLARERSRKRAIARQLQAAERRHQLYLIRRAASPTPRVSRQLATVDARLRRLREAAVRC
jgi:hypothetical protein